MKLSISITNGSSPGPAPALPGARERLVEDVVELSDMPEGERAQDCPERGRAIPVPEISPVDPRLWARSCDRCCPSRQASGAPAT